MRADEVPAVAELVDVLALRLAGVLASAA